MTFKTFMTSAAVAALLAGGAVAQETSADTDA